MGFTVVGAVIAVLVLLVLGVRTFCADSPGDDLSTKSAQAPFAIDRRPMPKGENLEQLLPHNVGPYERGEIRTGRDLGGDPTYVDYDDGQDKINIELGICRSAEDAQQGVRTAIAESADVCVATEAKSVGTDPSFHMGEFNNPRMGESGSGVRIAWSRGRYYFSAGARTRDVLDRFMKVFPY